MVDFLRDGMNEVSLKIDFPPQYKALFKQAKDIQKCIQTYQKILNTKTKYTFCPVCSNGYLYPFAAGKIGGVFNDYWLICDNCNAKFDKRLNSARLVEVESDPYGTFKKYGNKLLSLKKWNEITISRIKEYKNKYENSLAEIKAKVTAYILQQVIEGKVKLLLTDLSYFLLRKGEEPVFGTRGAIYEERKRRITKRVSTGGGGRSYGGFSFRLAKGVYYHVGDSAPAAPRESIAESVTYTENVLVEEGDFLATNQRLIFKGERTKGFTVSLNKVSAIEVDYNENKIMIVHEGRKPILLKLATSFTYYTEYFNIPITLDLDTIVSIIKRHQSI